MNRTILAIDIGTTSAKAALFYHDANCSALAKADIPALHLEDPVCHEVAPSAWEMAVASMAWDLAGDDPADWTQPGSWLEAFCQDTQAVLLAELELRLKPVAGLIAALGAASDNTPPVTQ